MFMGLDEPLLLRTTLFPYPGYLAAISGWGWGVKGGTNIC